MSDRVINVFESISARSISTVKSDNELVLPSVRVPLLNVAEFT